MREVNGSSPLTTTKTKRQRHLASGVFLLPSPQSGPQQLRICRGVALAIYSVIAVALPNAKASSVTSARQRGGRDAPVSCRAYCRPPLRSGLWCHSPSALSRALPSATFRVAKPHDSTSALRHGANNRPKGHCGPSACQENGSAEARRRRRFWTKGHRPRLHEPPTKPSIIYTAIFRRDEI